MKHTNLQGWNIGVHKQPGPAGQDDIWTLIFTETKPPTGDQIIFSMNREVRDHIVRELTGGIVLAGGELPKL